MRYKNPWHDPKKHFYGPEFYESDARPTKYGGFLIVHRLKKVWDIVQDGVCVDQRAGFGGAKKIIDILNKE